MRMDASLYFHGGTLVLQGVIEQTDLDLSAPFSFIKGKWRCEAYHFWKTVFCPVRKNIPRDRTLSWEGG